MIRIVPFLLTLKVKIWTVINKEKSSEANGLRGNLVGVTGFEPAASSSQIYNRTFFVPFQAVYSTFVWKSLAL